MTTFMILLCCIPALLGIALIVGACIALFSANAEDSKLRQAIDKNLAAGNVPKDPKKQLAIGLVLIGIGAVMLVLYFLSLQWGGSTWTWA